MKTSYFLSCWGNQLNLGTAVEVAADRGYDGVEGPPPEEGDLRSRVAENLATRGLPYIGEIVTGGDYVPKPGMTVDEHLEDFERILTGRFEGFSPKFINVLGGSDRWSVEESVSFFARAIELAATQGHSLVFETHRGRSMFNPWVTLEILTALPEMRLNCDFSHWVVVAERLVMDSEPEILGLCAKACGHMHARVGYYQ
ncbi:MAG: TIM barrel protein, partial [Verrucomicrobiota bacterium]